MRCGLVLLGLLLLPTVAQAQRQTFQPLSVEAVGDVVMGPRLATAVSGKAAHLKLVGPSRVLLVLVPSPCGGLMISTVLMRGPATVLINAVLMPATADLGSVAGHIATALERSVLGGDLP